MTLYLQAFAHIFIEMLYTAISINVVGSKYKTIRQDFKVMSKSAMPGLFSEDLRWRATWMKEMLGYEVDEVTAALKMSLSLKL